MKPLPWYTKIRPHLFRVIEVIKRIKIDARDVVAFAGIILLAVGCHMIYPPAGPISAGAVLLFIALRRW